MHHASRWDPVGQQGVGHIGADPTRHQGEHSGLGEPGRKHWPATHSRTMPWHRHPTALSPAMPAEALSCSCWKTLPSWEERKSLQLGFCCGKIPQISKYRSWDRRSGTGLKPDSGAVRGRPASGHGQQAPLEPALCDAPASTQPCRLQPPSTQRCSDLLQERAELGTQKYRHVTQEGPWTRHRPWSSAQAPPGYTHIHACLLGTAVQTAHLH